MVLTTKSSRTILLLALAFRVAVAIRFSYLHPDEHLQGPQEIAHAMFGWATQTPWEFQIENAVRSFVPLCLVYGIPMGFFESKASPVHVLTALRILFMLLTWILEDMAIDRLAATKNDKLRCLLYVSTSYITVVWQSHTFSNSFETILVLWFLVILVEAESHTAQFQSWFDRHYDSALLGLITVIGVFNRPTFIAFLAIPGLSLLKTFMKYPATLVTFLVSSAVVFCVCVSVDTLLYGNQTEWVITPLNFIRYNLKQENLSLHGIHSRLTHVLVNLPLLMGPGLLLMRPKWSSIPMQSVIGALAILSYIPHQELRFLLPLVPLLCCQMDLSFISSAKWRKILLISWLAFNAVMSVFMGFFHQGGVVPAQVFSHDLPRPSTVVWYKTYTPPLWMAGLKTEQVDFVALSDLGQTYAEIIEKAKNPKTGDVLTIIDLQGAPPTTLSKVVNEARENSQVYVVAPYSVYRDVQALKKKPEELFGTRYHIDPDLLDILRPSSLSFGLGVYNVTK